MEKSGGQIFLSILKIFLSVILSGLFVIMAFVFPVYYAAAGIVKPNNIVKVIQNIDYAEILKESDEFNAAMDELGIDTDTVDEIIKSKAVGGLLEGFADIMTDAMVSDGAEDFSIDALKEVADNHIDDITEVLQDSLDKSVKKEDVQAVMDQLIEGNYDAIESTVEDFTSENSMATAYRTVQKTVSWPVVLIVTLIEIAVLGLIYLLRAKKYGGFIWISVDSGIVMLMLTVTAVILNSGLAGAIIADMPGFALSVASSALGVITTNLIIAIVVLIVIMAASITAFILLRKRAQQKAIVQAKAPQSEDAEIADEPIQAE